MFTVNYYVESEKLQCCKSEVYSLFTPSINRYLKKDEYA